MSSLTSATALKPGDIPWGREIVRVGVPLQTDNHVGSATVKNVPGVHVPEIASTDISTIDSTLGFSEQEPETIVTTGFCSIYHEPASPMTMTHRVFAVAKANFPLFLRVNFLIHFV